MLPAVVQPIVEWIQVEPTSEETKLAVFDGSEELAINGMARIALNSQTASFTIAMAASQGAAGPSSIAAVQITDGSAVVRGILGTADAAAVRQVLGVQGNRRTRVQDVNYAVKAADSYVGVATLTAPRTMTLPSAATYLGGAPLWIADESGTCSTERPIIVAAAGDDRIAGQPNVQLTSPFQKLAFHSNETNLWTL